MRIIRVDDEGSDHTLLWIAAGAAIGLVAGVLVAKQLRGKDGSLRTLASRGRRLAVRTVARWEPLLDAVFALRDAWAQGDEDREADDGRDNDLAEELDDHDSDDADRETPVALDARVLEAFCNDPVLAERAVEIETDDAGGIILHGRVRSTREVKHALTLARGVPGVTSVRHQLAVRDRR